LIIEGLRRYKISKTGKQSSDKPERERPAAAGKEPNAKPNADELKADGAGHRIISFQAR
jgi:hypothetical protein